jgi:hypothetical protein
MTSPGTATPKPNPPASRWRARNLWIALGLYFAGAAFVAFWPRTAIGFGVKGESPASLLISLGPYGFLVDSLTTDAAATALQCFLGTSLVFLAMALPAVALRNGCIRGAFFAAAAVFWFLCGLFELIQHSPTIHWN